MGSYEREPEPDLRDKIFAKEWVNTCPRSVQEWFAIFFRNPHHELEGKWDKRVPIRKAIKRAMLVLADDDGLSDREVLLEWGFNNKNTDAVLKEIVKPHIHIPPDIKNAESHPVIKEYMTQHKEMGCCVQYIHPWFDGMCDCRDWGEKSPPLDVIEEGDDIVVLYLSIEYAIQNSVNETWKRHQMAQKRSEEIAKKKGHMESPKFKNLLQKNMMDAMKDNCPEIPDEN